ncbi:MAG: lipoate--protein ligase family protein [Candidatus Saccharicenans sp.]|uniref:lipoate--protein ligase family protein n=1 Tax=Candidatus Saccharicenans sp. TaxID=2819258 RepID=UPI00404B04A5
MSPKKIIRLLDLKEVPAVRSQTCYHAVGYAFGPETPDTIILVSPESPYVCVGFHQEAEREVDLDFCRQAGLPVYRREVGGGAVYLDRHQLFVQWIFHPESLPYPLEEKFRFYVEPIIRTYRELGIEASYRPINDIQVAGKKIGGTGAARIGQAEILVGSFMFDFDKKTMAQVLRVSSEKMRDKVFQSLEQYMTTMKELLVNVPVRALVKKIYLKQVAEMLDRQIVEGHLSEAELAEAERLDRLFQSEDWIFQKGPMRRPAIKIHEDVQVQEVDYKAPGGLIRLTARTKGQRLDSVWISGDFTAIPKEAVAEMEKALSGVMIDEKSVTEAVSRALAESGLKCPGLDPEDWVKAVLKLGAGT